MTKLEVESGRHSGQQGDPQDASNGLPTCVALCLEQGHKMPLKALCQLEELCSPEEGGSDSIAILLFYT